MDLEELLKHAQAAGASDLHIAGGGRAAWRVNGNLAFLDQEMPDSAAADIVNVLLDEGQRKELAARGSVDLALTVGGVRCRINAFHADNDLNLAVRLLPQAVPTVADLNLHPAFADFPRLRNGLILISGPTGCGKSSTLAALVTAVNCSEARHVITIESPIEFVIRSERSFVQQREVGRDTPSFEQGTLDALRQDPDVLVVGEMREPEVMRLVLGAAETGHVVMTTVHSSNCAEALQRIVSAFPPEIQGNIAAQLADVLQVVVAQHLYWRPEANMRIPECEVLKTNAAVRNHVRSRDFFKLASDIEIGAEEGMFTFERYGRWVASQKAWRQDGAPEAAPPPASKPAEEQQTTVPKAGRIEITPYSGSLEGILKKSK